MAEVKYGLNEMNRGTDTSNDVKVTPFFIPVRRFRPLMGDSV